FRRVLFRSFETAREVIGLEHGRLADPALRRDIAWLEIDEQALGLSLDRARDEARAGASLGASSAMFKYFGTELNKRRQELLMSISGLAALDWGGPESNDGLLPRAWLRCRADSLEGGTTESQLNIVSRQLLGLPG